MELAYSGLLATAVAFQAIGQQYVPPANAAIILSAESLFAALGGALILGERLPPIGYAGAVLIFAAILAVEALPRFGPGGASISRATPISAGAYSA
jgi:drug/metabolite transporter (DMT)-like permease